MSIILREAIDILSLSYPRLNSEGFGSRFADEVLSKMWVKYPWQQSLAKLPPFYLTAYETDYGPPTSAVPNDYFALYDAWLRNWNLYEKELAILHDLKPSSWTGEPEAIAYVPETGCFRVHPRPNVNPPYWWVEGRYKKQPTKITDANLITTAFPFNDVYFSVFRQGMYWKYQQEIVKSQEHALQYSLFMQMLKEMAISEGIHQGSQALAPEHGLALGG